MGAEKLGIVAGGSFEAVYVIEEPGSRIEIGDLIVTEEENVSLLLKVTSLRIGFPADESRGLLDRKSDPTVALCKPVARIENGMVVPAKIMPRLGTGARLATAKDLEAITSGKNDGIFLGSLRSGSKILELPLKIDGTDLLSHHILVAATTGRGKSNLLKTMIWSSISSGGFGMLVLDSHDEYYGRNGSGLKDHPEWGNGNLYYSTSPQPGGSSLVINLSNVEPDHFFGVMDLTDAQKQAMVLYNRQYGSRWIENLVLGTEEEQVDNRTVRVLRRKLRLSMGIYGKNGRVICETNAFSQSAGTSTINSIISALESGKTVILDTSRIGDEAELLIGSMVSTEIFARYRNYKGEGVLERKPPVSVLIEEAPRVLSEEKIQEEDNVFASIAREGRKFRIGLIAVTQIVSVIPKTILTNLNTKIILGMEMAMERRILLDSCSNDMSLEDQAVASLDRGEAVVSSIFTKFGIPIYTPLFTGKGENS